MKNTLDSNQENAHLNSTEDSNLVQEVMALTPAQLELISGAGGSTWPKWPPGECKIMECGKLLP